MTATYTNQPGTVDIDTVRHEVNDKDCDPESGAQLTDQEIQYAIDTNNHILLAAASCAEQIAATYAPEPKSKMVGDLQVNYGGEGRYATYTSLAKSLRTRAAKKVGSKVYAGGLSKTDKQTAERDTDRVQPVFQVGMDDSLLNPGQTNGRGVMDY